MRLAGSQDVYDALTNQPSDQAVEDYVEVFELLKSKGLGDAAAEYHATEMIEGREPMATLTPRFAGVYVRDERGIRYGVESQPQGLEISDNSD